MLRTTLVRKFHIYTSSGLSCVNLLTRCLLLSGRRASSNAAGAGSTAEVAAGEAVGTASTETTTETAGDTTAGAAEAEVRNESKGGGGRGEDRR